jgi:F-type H+-transporting ATPase subunit alpha
MSIAEQVVCIYSGVRGFIDKIDPSLITKFEEEFMAHVRATQQELLKTITVEGHLSEATEAKMKELTTSFVKTFRAAHESEAKA